MTRIDIDIPPGTTDADVLDAVRWWISDNANIWDFGGTYELPDGRVVETTWRCEESFDADTGDVAIFFADVEVRFVE